MPNCPHCGLYLYSEGFLDRHLKTCSKNEKFISAMGNPRTVLLIDDDEHTLMVFKDIIETKNHTVYTCKDSPQAIHDYIKLSPDVVIMDLQMPQQSGCTVIDKIKQYDPYANIVVVTGHPNYDKDCKKIKVEYSIPIYLKPIHAEKLQNIVHGTN